MPRKRQPLPSVSEVVEQIRSRVAEVPNHRLVCARVLGESERTLKTAAVVEILDEQSQSPHRELHLSDYGIGVLGAVQWEAKRRLGRWSCAGAEIDQLRALLGDELLQTAPPLDAPVPTEACAAVARVHALGLGALVSVLARRSEELAALPGRASTDGRRIVAAALRAALRRTTLAALRQLIDRGAAAGELLPLLARDPWLLGGRYLGTASVDSPSEPHLRALAFQAADGAMELVVLGPSAAALVAESAGVLSASAAVGEAAGRAEAILRRYKPPRIAPPERFARRRAKVVLGRLPDEPAPCAEALEALERDAVRWPAVEVLGYDELVRRGEAIVEADLVESRRAAVEYSGATANGRVVI